MNDLANLVRSELRDLADTGAPPPDLADRAVTAGVRRVRRRFAAAGGAVVAAAVAVTLAATQLVTPQAQNPRPDPGPAAPEPRNVVFAKFKGTTVEVLNPATGEYRAVDVMVVMNASADLRYASVLPQQAPDGPPDKRVGRLDTTTGEIRWYDAPERWSAPPTISPDGRYLVVPIRTTAEPDAGIVIVDTFDGSSRAFGLDATTAAAINVFVGNVSFDRDPPDVRPRQFFDYPLSWHPDSRHVLVGNVIVDLTGRPTGTLPIPDAWLVAYRPQLNGLLVVPRRELNSYVLTDASGSGTLDWTCTDPSPVACPRLYFDSFLGWRGDGHILVTSPDAPGPGIDAIELRTGKRTRVTTYDASRVLVAPADSLAPGVRDAVSF